MSKRKIIDRSWFEPASDMAVVHLRTQASLERTSDKRAAEARERIAEERRQAMRAASRPVLIGKMRGTSYWSDMLGVSEETIRIWCKSGEVQGQWLRNKWLISDQAMAEFLEKENQRHVRQG